MQVEVCIETRGMLQRSQQYRYAYGVLDKAIKTAKHWSHKAVQETIDTGADRRVLVKHKHFGDLKVDHIQCERHNQVYANLNRRKRVIRIDCDHTVSGEHKIRDISDEGQTAEDRYHRTYWIDFLLIPNEQESGSRLDCNPPIRHKMNAPAQGNGEQKQFPVQCVRDQHITKYQSSRDEIHDTESDMRPTRKIIAMNPYGLLFLLPPAFIQIENI
mmetsp:Transcript_46794/g.77698  ORF Transcript_46794/g.77698 Transcript_46794/m.77698 type:complete len:215 (+) Transcript_46794:935-1579(+)